MPGLLWVCQCCADVWLCLGMPVLGHAPAALQLLLEDEDALALVRGQHCDLLVSQLQHLHDQRSLK